MHGPIPRFSSLCLLGWTQQQRIRFSFSCPQRLAFVVLRFEQSSWEYSDIDAEYGELWNATDRIQGAQKIEALKRYDGLKDVETLVFVGGNKGGTVAAIVAAHPQIHRINFDFPHVVAGAPNVPGISHETFLPIP